MNASEKQLKEFLEFKSQHYPDMTLILRCQGDNTIIEKDAINLCEVRIGSMGYLFGGISEKFYDEMVKKHLKNENE